jgi:peptide deformylase
MPVKKNFLALLPADLYAPTEADKERAAQEISLGMVSPRHPALNRRAKAVARTSVKSPLIQDIIQRLFVAAGSQQSHSKQSKLRRMLVGLAAPQIGESWRIAVIDTRVTADRKHNGRLECFINPKIIWRSKETEEGREGCFSAGPVWGLVRRSLAVKVRALTAEGEPVEKDFEGFTARIIQHEIDHLDGIRFPNRIRSDKKRHWVHTEEIPLYPKNIHNWHRSCSRERWLKFKHGK